MNEDVLSKLHDIKELERIPDNSIFIFSTLIFLGIILILLTIFLLIKYFKNRKISDRKSYYNILKNIDFSDSKNTAYTITKYSRLVALSDREKKLANELIEELEIFKYKKSVDNINSKTKAKFSTFMDALDV
jgi:ribosomal protein S10